MASQLCQALGPGVGLFRLLLPYLLGEGNLQGHKKPDFSFSLPQLPSLVPWTSEPTTLNLNVCTHKMGGGN